MAIQNTASPSSHFAGGYLISGPGLVPDLEDIVSYSYFVIAE